MTLTPISGKSGSGTTRLVVLFRRLHTRTFVVVGVLLVFVRVRNKMIQPQVSRPQVPLYGPRPFACSCGLCAMIKWLEGSGRHWPLRAGQCPYASGWPLLLLVSSFQLSSSFTRHDEIKIRYLYLIMMTLAYVERNGAFCSWQAKRTRGAGQTARARERTT